MTRIRIDLPERFAFKTEMTVRVGDINYGGHLGNDAVLSLLHEARLRFLKSHGFTELDVDGAGILMADAALVYRAQGFQGEVLIAEVAVGPISGHGCDLLYRLSRREGGEEVARAKTGIVFYDYDKKKVAPVPVKFKAIFKGA
jgi:acyl-CoA thioesterase FadM